MTEMNVNRSLDCVMITGLEAVLEVGGDRDFPFLQTFRKKGCQCFASNLYFYYPETGSDPASDVIKVVADMNRLPYRDDMFDIVLLSATLHHSPQLAQTLSEFSRVLRPGGTLLLLSEPVQGALKSAWRLGRFRSKGRDEDIHEQEYSIADYEAAIGKSGLRVTESFFSPFYDHKLKRSDMKSVRFWPLAKLLSLFWKNKTFRSFAMSRGLRTAQAILGLQLNLLLTKSA